MVTFATPPKVSELAVMRGRSPSCEEHRKRCERATFCECAHAHARVHLARELHAQVSVAIGKRRATQNRGVDAVDLDRANRAERLKSSFDGRRRGVVRNRARCLPSKCERLMFRDALRR